MNIIQQIIINTLPEICDTIQNIGLQDIGKVTKDLVQITQKMTLEIVEACIAQMDEALVCAAKAQRRLDGITIKERDVSRTVTTDLGVLHYKRTYFELPDKTYAYLVDYLIGIEAYERFTREFIADLLELSTVKSYQQAIEIKGNVYSRQTVHNRLAATKNLAMPVERVKDTPETLDIFADEDHAHLRPKGDAIVPLVTITEGIDESNPKRHKTVNPLHMGAYGMTAEAFRENVLAVLGRRYDLGKVKVINVHGDGGQWIRGLQESIPHARFVLDGYHLEKELRSVLGLEEAWRYAKELRAAMRREDGYADFRKCCRKIAIHQKTVRERDKVKAFAGYCRRHWSAVVLRMKKETCGSCTEAMVSHVLSDRLSRDPIAWSEVGLARMAMLVVYTKNGGKIRGEDVGVRVDDREISEYAKGGFSQYREYAMKQAEEVLKAKYDWSIFEHEDSGYGKIDWTHMIRRSLGASQSLSELVS